VAVVLVIGYHLSVPGMDGGLLGVGMFFTLSGFLITGILLSRWHRTGRHGLGRFYLHRSRRLLPAVITLLVVVLLATTVTAGGQTYFDRFSGPGPLDHLWSLAVEEQFNLVWPVLLLLLMAIPRITLRVVAGLTEALAAASFALMWALAVPGFDHTRACEGTDTRAGGLLVGAVLALLLWHPEGAHRGQGMTTTALDRRGLAGVLVIAALVILTDEYSMWLCRGGLVLLSLATAAVLASASHPGSVLSTVLGWRPQAWVGERSYGIYLWHLPVIALLPLRSWPTARCSGVLWSLR
jgi:peptidoglycan/LPS O-acetylase OafA/YrhL